MSYKKGSSNMALKYPELFKPFKIGRCEVKNKIVMSGMHNIGWTDDYDIIDDNVIDYFEARAKGGVGMNIVEATYVAAAATA